MKATLLILAVMIQAAQDPGPWRIVIEICPPHGTGFCEVKSVRADGTELRDYSEKWKYPGGWSADGKRRLFVLEDNGIRNVCVYEPDTGRETKLTDTKGVNESPCWSSDGRHVVFASTRSGQSQIWIMDADGRNPKQLTREEDGAMQPRAGGGRIAYLQKHNQPREKLPPCTLKTIDLSGGDSKIVIEKSQILEHEWNPKGDRIAVSVVQELKVLDMPSGKVAKSFKLPEVHKDLFAHAAYRMLWRPDGGAIACTFHFLGGRMAGTKIFGDEQLFVLPWEGKPAIIEAGGSVLPLGWIR